MAVDTAGPDWESITPVSGAVALRLWNISEEAFPNFDYAFGSVLVEMLDSRTIRIEWFDTHDEITAFTPAARIYER